MTCQNVNIICGCGCGTAQIVIIMQLMLANGANNFGQWLSRNLKSNAPDIPLHQDLIRHLDTLLFSCGCQRAWLWWNGMLNCSSHRSSAHCTGYVRWLAIKLPFKAIMNDISLTSCVQTDFSLSGTPPPLSHTCPSVMPIALVWLSAYLGKPVNICPKCNFSYFSQLVSQLVSVLLWWCCQHCQAF